MVAHLTPLLTAVGLKIHCVTGGVKRPRSLADKLRRKPGRYPTLEDVTDLVGVRVITSFERDVNVVARMIEEHFVVDWDNSSDTHTNCWSSMWLLFSRSPPSSGSAERATSSARDGLGRDRSSPAGRYRALRSAKDCTRA